VRNWVNKTSAAPIPSANNPIQTTKDIMISMDKHFPINRGMDSEENRAAMEEFIGRHGNDRPANIDDGNKIAMHHDEDVRMITSVFKSATSRPGAPGIPTGESDSTFRASRLTSWRLEFSS
jgi:hypothetical protein